MGKVDKINISKKNNGVTYYVEKAYLEKDKGIRGDRYYNNFKEKKEQVTLIESEMIKNFNNQIDQIIDYKDFRRNVVTKNIRLDNLIGKKIRIGNKATLYVHELCQPCNYLQKKLNIENLVKLLVNKSGVSAEIISSGEINDGDKIVILD